MKEVIKIFEQLQNTSGMNDKQAIINRNKLNPLFKKCLVFLLDTTITTGISTKKLSKNMFGITPSNMTFEELMDYLQKNNTGRDADVKVAKCFLAAHREDKDFYEKMITKTLRLGCNAKLVNKVIPGLIYEFNVMLGKAYENVSLKGNERIFITQKLNGTRCCFVNGKFFTRQGKEYLGLENLRKDVEKCELNRYFMGFIEEARTLSTLVVR